MTWKPVANALAAVLFCGASVVCAYAVREWARPELLAVLAAGWWALMAVAALAVPLVSTAVFCQDAGRWAQSTVSWRYIGVRVIGSALSAAVGFSIGAYILAHQGWIPIGVR